MQKIYKKVYTRAHSLLSLCYWYEGERKELYELSHNSLYFEPLFIYRKGEGVSVYYDFFDLDQVPDNAAKYFNKHKEDFFALEFECKKLVKRIDEICKDPKAADFDALYNLVRSFFPYMSLYVILSGEVAAKADKEIAEKALQMRHDTDQVIYRAEEALITIAKERLPQEYHPFIDFLTYSEISSGVLPDMEKLGERKEGYIYFEGTLTVLSEIALFKKEHEILFAHDLNEEIPVDQSEVKGMAASKGKVRGTVRVVRERGDFDNVQTGDILVTAMTTPDFMSVMRRAAAFVTDEGGITCHAAIVSREMKKPCIIGTKVATQVLKDGVEVEVDADNGIVRILT